MLGRNFNSTYQYLHFSSFYIDEGLPYGSDGKQICLQCRRPGFDPWIRNPSGEGNGNPLQYSCPETLMDRGDWQATVDGVEKSRIQLSDQHFYYYFNSSYQNLHFSSFLVHEKMEA